MTSTKTYRIVLAHILGAALMFSAASPRAEDNPELYFYPAKPWQVVPVADQSCSMMNEFNNGFVLQITGTHGDINNLSLDLRQPVLTSGSTYDVSLGIPGAPERDVQGRATSDQLLTVDLRNSTGLYGALQTASVLDIGLDGNSFRFYMIGFADAAKQFDGCSTAIQNTTGASRPPPAMRPVLQTPPAVAKAPAQATTQKATIAKVSDDKLFELLNKQGSYKGEPKAPPQEKAPQQASAPQSLPLEPLDTEDVLAAPAKDTTLKELAAPPFTYEESDEPAQTHAGLSEQLAEEIKRNPEVAAIDPMPGKPEAQIFEISEKKTDTTQNADEAMKNAQDKAAARVAAQADKPVEKIETIPDEKRILPKPKIKKTVTPPIKYNREKITAQADLRHLDETKPSAGEDLSFPTDRGVNVKMSELERKIAMLMEENAAMQKELNDSLKESEQERLSISSENWNLERATMRYNEAERQITRLGRELQNERAQCSLEKKKLEAMLFDPEVTNQQQIARLTELEQQLAAAKAQIEALQRQ